MRIAVLSRRFNPAGGGTERDLIVTCDYLVRAGHDVTVYAADIRGVSKALHTRRAWAVPFGRALRLVSFAYLAAIQARNGGAELTISFGRTVDAEVQRCGGGVYKSYLKAAHRWRGPFGARLMQLSPYRQLQAHIESRGFTSPNLRLVLAVSQAVSEDLVANFAIAAHKVVTLYNGVDLDRFRPVKDVAAKQHLRRQFGLPPSTRVIAFAGHGFARKGLGFLLQAWPQLKGEPWLVVAGQDHERGVFRRLAARLGLVPRVVFLGNVADIAQLYQAVDGLALPTLFEAFGNVVVEAMASGLPVLTSTSAGVAEIIPQQLRSYLVNNPTDPEELAARLQALLAAPADVGATARATAEEFTWERYGARLVDLIEKCRRSAQATAEQRDREGA
jgi:UDP-glucose:(heptosyl)LPS alpha-1,3-glucosyltransferase